MRLFHMRGTFSITLSSVLKAAAFLVCDTSDSDDLTAW